MKRLLYSVDNAVRIESFAGSSRETNPVYKDYHGLFHITKLSALYSLVPFVPPSLDMAFKLKRKKFVIEKLHLPPGLFVALFFTLLLLAYCKITAGQKSQHNGCREWTAPPRLAQKKLMRPPSV